MLPATPSWISRLAACGFAVLLLLTACGKTSGPSTGSGSSRSSLPSFRRSSASSVASSRSSSFSSFSTGRLPFSLSNSSAGSGAFAPVGNWIAAPSSAAGGAGVAPANSSELVKVHIDADKSQARAGDQVYFTVTIKNISSAPLSNFQVLYAFSPVQLTVGESDGVAGNGSVEWTIDSLQPNQKRALRVQAALANDLQQGDAAHVTAVATVNGITQESTGNYDVRAIVALPRTGPGDNFAPLENTSRYLFPLGNTTAVPAIVWAAAALLGIAGGGVIGKRYFL